MTAPGPSCARPGAGRDGGYGRFFDRRQHPPSTGRMSSRAEELHLRALPEPDVTSRS
jgi:hypothetical protein